MFIKHYNIGYNLRVILIAGILEPDPKCLDQKLMYHLLSLTYLFYHVM